MKLVIFICQETFKLRDVTEDAKLIIKCVRDLTSGRKADYTLIHFIEIFKGKHMSWDLSLGFPTRTDANQADQSLKIHIVRSLKFWI